MNRRKLQVRTMIEGERYVDFNGKPLQLLGYVFCELQGNDSYVKKARILIAKSRTKFVIGRVLSNLRIKLVAEDDLKVNRIEREKELDAENKRFVKELPKLFERRRKVNKPGPAQVGAISKAQK